MTKRRPPQRNRKNDIQELERAFQNLSDKKKSKTGKYASSKPHFITPILGLIACICAIALLIGGCTAFNIFRDNQEIPAEISILGVEVGGMTRSEAQAVIEKAFQDRYVNQTVTVTIEEHSVQLPYELSQVKLNSGKAVDKAVNYLKNTFGEHQLDISDCISVNNDAVLSKLDTFIPLVTSTLRQSTYDVTGNMPEFYDTVDEEASLILTINKGVPGVRLDTMVLLDTLLDGFSAGLTEIEYECPTVMPADLDWDTLAEEYIKYPVEAEMDPETFEVTGGTYGYGFDVEAVKKEYEQADFGQVLEIPYQWVKPEVSAEEMKGLLFRDVLATYTTQAGSNYDRNTNLELASETINGLILYPGDVFSFNEILGERTPEKGYRPGVSYIGGQSVLDYGGGICQVATTIYYCAVISDLEIVERDCHGYASSYTPLSTDATVFYGGIDFRFKNNDKFPIRIDVSSANGDVTVNLVGTDTKDYYIKFESQWLETIPYEVEYKEFAPDNEKGYKDGYVLVDPYTGYRSQAYRVKYDKETNEEIERTLENKDYYSYRNKVVVKIVSEETEPPTEDETPPASDPAENDPTVPPESTPEQTEPPAVEEDTTPSE